MSISIYLILLIVLLVFNLVFWLLIIWFRILFNCEFGICCPDTESIADEVPPIGHGNPGYIDDEAMTSPQMPFTISEAMECPPSYEDAIKYDQFGFLPAPERTESASPRALESSPQLISSLVEHTQRATQLPQNPVRAPEVRTRSSTTSSGSVNALTPITEEELGETPVSVVIDSIGVQTSRLLIGSIPKVDIPEGGQLKSHSKC